MKKIIAIAILLVAPAVMASGTCPASPGDIEGQIRCGEMTCDLFMSNSTYVMGGTCSPQRKFYCCVNGGPFRSMESVAVETLSIEFVERGNKTFDGLTNGVHVRMLVNGQQVPGPMGQGRFVDGFLEMNNGDTYLVLAGDLFLVDYVSEKETP